MWMITIMTTKTLTWNNRKWSFQKDELGCSNCTLSPFVTNHNAKQESITTKSSDCEDWRWTVNRVPADLLFYSNRCTVSPLRHVNTAAKANRKKSRLSGFGFVMSTISRCHIWLTRTGPNRSVCEERNTYLHSWTPGGTGGKTKSQPVIISCFRTTWLG